MKRSENGRKTEGNEVKIEENGRGMRGNGMENII